MRILIVALLVLAALPAVAPPAAGCHVVLPVDVFWDDGSGGENWLHVYYDGCRHSVCVEGALGLTSFDRCVPG